MRSAYTARSLYGPQSDALAIAPRPLRGGGGGIFHETERYRP